MYKSPKIVFQRMAHEMYVILIIILALVPYYNFRHISLSTLLLNADPDPVYFNLAYLPTVFIP